jgi:lipopolysaccharide transport system permease protein
LVLFDELKQENNKLKSENDLLTIIEPAYGWKLINLKELKAYRDLFFFLVWRDIKVLYAQTILGLAWALLQPLVQIILFTIIFGRVAKISTDGIPYVLYVSLSIIPWTYMSQAMSQSSQSLVSGQGMLGKIYFPRLIFPITPVLARLVDFSIALLIILCVTLYYRVYPTWNIVFFPLFIVMMISIPTAVGLWLSSLAIRFRDVRYAMTYVIQLLMYTAPIVYSASSIPQQYRIIYSLNPIVGVIEGFRACLLGTPFQWQFIVPGMITTIIMLISGMFYFKRMEWFVADVI